MFVIPKTFAITDISHTFNGTSAIILSNQRSYGTKYRTFKKRLTLIDDTTIKANSHELKNFIVHISPQYKSGCVNWAVTSTNVNITISVAQTAKRLNGWCIVIVADKDGPQTYVMSENKAHVFYLTVHLQYELSKRSKFVASLPWNHFGRKNVGYLWAIVQGAEAIWDFDDDHELIIDQLTVPVNDTDALMLPNLKGSLLNPYSILEDNEYPKYPRGFPGQLMKNSTLSARNEVVLSGVWPAKWIGIVQCLASNDSDVYSSYRLPRPSNSQLKYLQKDRKLIVPRGTFSPYNTHATLHLRSALWTLLLPIGVDPHVSDIWRSYAMQRLMWDSGLQVSFAGSYVTRRRNTHSLSQDMNAKHDLDLQTEKLIEFLSDWSASSDSLVKRVEELYIALYERGFLESVDVELVQLWLFELIQNGYVFPMISAKFTLAVRTYAGHIQRMNSR
ncbi:unnamed protein product [Rotaria magnacalcarata]|uniref:Uncharacterized protein n=1 Tax=Rotaria magnacalcarata TaxID=392030 RepID=A0A816WPX5_9BILA|nr:unnamed protein product [Rotaria magnacalcarata]